MMIGYYYGGYSSAFVIEGVAPKGNWEAGRGVTRGREVGQGGWGFGKHLRELNE